VKTSVFIAGALLVFALFSFCRYKFRVGRVASSAPAASKAHSQEGKDLRQFMESKVHQEYTFLSFTIWHDRPLTPAKMDAIAASSSRVMEMSQQLTAYAAIYKEQGWSTNDMKLFEENRLQLSRIAEELNRAAQRHATPDVIDNFQHLNGACQSCHKRFRPDLKWL
jgi:cytochrome c556